jgi:hypothetical protein
MEIERAAELKRKEQEAIELENEIRKNLKR